jgi:hypothetical protein
MLPLLLPIDIGVVLFLIILKLNSLLKAIVAEASIKIFPLKTLKLPSMASLSVT